MYTNTTEADHLSYLFEHGDLNLDEIIRRAVSDLIEGNLRYLAFVDGSEWVLPCITTAEAA